jgi:hypothetical protein
VRVLQGAGGVEDVHPVAAEFLRERAPFGLAGEDFQRVGGYGEGHQYGKQT